MLLFVFCLLCARKNRRGSSFWPVLGLWNVHPLGSVPIAALPKTMNDCPQAALPSSITPQKADNPLHKGALHFRNARADECRDVFTRTQLGSAAAMMPARLLDRFAWPPR